MESQKRIAVVLASHGEAETGGFIENYRVSLHTLGRASSVMPIPLPLRHLISCKTSLAKRLRHAGQGSGSPQNRITRNQASLLQRHLDRHPASAAVAFRVFAAHAASDPAVEAVLADTMGYDAQVVVPMAPVDNSLSCGFLCRHIADRWPAEHLHRIRVVGRLWADDALLDAYASHLFDGAHQLPAPGRSDTVLLLLCHGTLVCCNDGSAPAFHTGAEATAAFAGRLAERIRADRRNPWGRIEVAYLNHDVGGVWTQPSFESASRELVRSGCRHVTLFAAGYFSDGNETVRRAAELAAAAPSFRIAALPCLNEAPAFTSFLASRVTAAAAQILACC